MRMRAIDIVLAAGTVLLVAACSLPGQGKSTPPGSTASSKVCSVSPPSPGSGPATQVEPSVAEQIVRQYWDASDRQNQRPARLDCRAAQQADEGPALAMSVTSTQVDQQLGRSDQDKPNPIQSLNLYVPRLQSYPLWFATIVKKFDVDQNTGKVSSKVAYRLMVFTRMAAGARWKEYLETDVPGGNPGVAMDAQGYVPSPTGSPAFDPAALPQAYVDYLTSRGKQHGDLFEPGSVDTDGAIAQTKPENGLTHTFARYDGLVFPLALQDGGVMVVFDDLWQAHAAANGSTCYVQDDKRSKLPVFYPPGRWHQVEIDSIMVWIAFVPNRTGQVLLAGDNGLVLSRGSNPC
jgi:hypothetical protein